MGILGPEVIAKPVDPDAAIEFWRQRAKLTDAEAKALGAGAKQRAFYVSGLARRDLVQLVSDGIQAALENGETLADFKGRIAGAIAAEGWHGYRVENIFRTNMQTAYAAGRYKKMQAVKASRPYWQYLAILDKRTRPGHAILHLLVYPAAHEFWAANYPPNGFRCRCGVRTLSARQVRSMGLDVQTNMPGPGVYTDPKTGMEYFVHFPGADKGFRSNPGKDWLDGLDLKKYPDLTPKSYEEQRGKGIIKSVSTNEELAKQIHDHASPFMANGAVRNVAFDRESYFMATNSRGNFWISQRDFSMEGGTFNPAANLKNAWNKIAKGEQLTFHEEYSVESLWHEIVHNRQTPTNAGGQNTVSRRMMETVTQWVASRTYPRFMEALGGKATHQAKVLKDGYGYKGYIRNFDRLLEVLGVADNPEALAYFEEVCRTQDRKSYLTAITDYLSRNGKAKANKSTIREVLGKTNYSEGAFDQWLGFYKLTE